MDKISKELKEVKEDIELIKLSILNLGGMQMSIESFEKGRYGERDKKYFREEWEKLKERAKKLGLLD